MSSAAPTPLPPIHAFRAGKHVNSAGQETTWSAADLQELADSYDPALREAPITIGHPAGNAPAFGWIGQLQTDGANLQALPSHVQPEFADWVQRKLFKKVSVSIYGRDHPNNPVPGKLYLRHVGFLGAQPPAVAGLKDYSFSEAEGDLQVYEFGDWSDRTVAQLLRGLRDFFISKFGLDEANKALPDWQVQALAEEAMREDTVSETQAAGLSYSEGDPMSGKTAAELAAQAAELDEREKKVRAEEAALEAQKRQAEHAGRMAQFSDFCDGLVKTGQLLPKHKAAIVAVMGALPHAEVLEFGEGDGLVKAPAVEVLQGYLKQLPKLVDFSERAPKGKTSAAVDVEDGAAVGRAAAEFMEAEQRAGRVISVEQAVQHVITTNQEA